jgi:hypothetical protein
MFSKYTTGLVFLLLGCYDLGGSSMPKEDWEATPAPYECYGCKLQKACPSGGEIDPLKREEYA